MSMRTKTPTPSSTAPERDDRTAPPPSWRCQLPEFCLIRVSGKDAFSFLNNQLVNQLAEVSEEASQLSGYCNPRGRLFAAFRVFMRGEDYYLRTTADNAEPVTGRLRLFVLRSEVSLEMDSGLGCLGLIGEDAADLLDDAGAPVPAKNRNSVRHADFSVIHAPGVRERYEIYAPREPLADLERKLAPGTATADNGTWRLYDVLSGIPNIYSRTRELFVPQMVNFDLIGALSFSKGCYPGQEVIARTHYRGKLKRRMYRFALARPSRRVAPGDPVFVPAYSTEQPSGEVVDACQLSDGTLTGLASLRARGLEHGEIRLGAADGEAAQIADLPYEVVTESGDVETEASS